VKKALVTGGAGTLGSSLVKMLLKKDYEVHVIDTRQVNEATKLEPNIKDIQYHWKSIHDMTANDLEGVELVAHCAAQPDRPLGIASPIYTLDVNIMGLAVVLEACKHSQTLTKFLYPGSGTIFSGVPHEELPVTEDSIPKPTNPYSASKYMGEILCNTYRRCYGVPTVILRSGLVYGAGMRLDISIAQFIIKALQGKQFMVRSPNATRTPTHIDDVLLFWNAVIDLEPSQVVGNIFHSVYGKEYSVIDIARTVTKVVGKGLAQPSKEYEDGEFGAREWTTTTKQDELKVYCNVDLEEGLRRTIPYIMEHV